MIESHPVPSDSSTLAVELAQLAVTVMRWAGLGPASDRGDLIAWLESNDPNGCYSDADAISEWGEPNETWGPVLSLIESYPNS